MPHLLVIDDEPQIRRTLARAFSCDFVVTCAPDAESALAMIDEGTLEGVVLFDAVVCDMKLPRMSGHDLYDELLCRCHELVGRIVILSGATPDGDDAFATSLGERYMLKPCPMVDLIAILRRLAMPRVTVPWTAPVIAA